MLCGPCRDMNRPWTGRGWSSSAPASPASPRGATRPEPATGRPSSRWGRCRADSAPPGGDKGYLFDGSVAGLAGTSPEAPIHRLWRDIGVVDYCPLYDPVDFGTVVAPDGRAVTVYTDIDRLEAHLLGSFPVDAATIAEFARALRSCRGSTSRSAPRVAWRRRRRRPGGRSVAAQPAGAAQVRAPHAAPVQRPAAGSVLPAGVRQPRPLRRPGRARAHRPPPHRLRTPPDDGHPAQRLARVRPRGRAALPRARRGDPLRREGRGPRDQRRRGPWRPTGRRRGRDRRARALGRGRPLHPHRPARGGRRCALRPAPRVGPARPGEPRRDRGLVRDRRAHLPPARTRLRRRAAGSPGSPCRTSTTTRTRRRRARARSPCSSSPTTLLEGARGGPAVPTRRRSDAAPTW